MGTRGSGQRKPRDWLYSGECARTQVISSLQWDGGVNLVSYSWIFFSLFLVIAWGYPTPLKHRSYKKRKENDSLERPLSFKAKEVNLNPETQEPCNHRVAWSACNWDYSIRSDHSPIP